MDPKFAILLDGGFVTKILQRRLSRFPTAEDIEKECARIGAHPALKGHTLLRVYFYDAPPATGIVKNPLDKSETDLSKTHIYSQHESLLDKLELMPDFAVRKGETLAQGWKLGKSAIRSMYSCPRTRSQMTSCRISFKRVWIFELASTSPDYP